MIAAALTLGVAVIVCAIALGNRRTLRLQVERDRRTLGKSA